MPFQADAASADPSMKSSPLLKVDQNLEKLLLGAFWASIQTPDLWLLRFCPLRLYIKATVGHHCHYFLLETAFSGTDSARYVRVSDPLQTGMALAWLFNVSLCFRGWRRTVLARACKRLSQCLTSLAAFGLRCPCSRADLQSCPQSAAEVSQVAGGAREGQASLKRVGHESAVAVLPFSRSYCD